MRSDFSFRLPLLSFSITILMAGIFCLPTLMWAQSGANSGEIAGQVLDPSSAAVAGAQVTVRNENTNFSRSVTTDAAGRYAASALPVGSYEVTVQATGFEPAKEKALVASGSTITVDLNLSMGVNREAVEVKAGMQSDTTLVTSKSVLTALQISDLPSNGGRLQNLIWDIPGGLIEPE